MSKIFFRQIPKGAKVLAIGNIFRSKNPGSFWRVASLLEVNDQVQSKTFNPELACLLGVGRVFIQEENEPYVSKGYRQTLSLPDIDSWQERPLGECHRLARPLARMPEVAHQKCFVFEVAGITYWLPKFELARKLFFHAGFLSRAAFEPNGLDMLFTVTREEGVIHINTPAKTGAPARILQNEAYRNHLSWLLLDPEVKRSFESIWQCLNEAKPDDKSGYLRRQFDFHPPSCVSGVEIVALGPLDWESKEMLVWEIKALKGLKWMCFQEVQFHHPALKLSVSGELGGARPPSSNSDSIELDGERDTNEDKTRQLLDLPPEAFSFQGHCRTRAVYQGQRGSRLGQKQEGELLPGDGAHLGLCDDVTGGELAPAELQQLDDPAEQQSYPNRFESLKEIIKEIAKQPDIELLAMVVKPLPHVPRRGHHLMEDGTPRCYLVAHFRLSSGQERFLLEVDTSDNKKRLSTRIVRMMPGVDAAQAITQILKDTVQASLRWPMSIQKFCDGNEPVHHPKEDPHNLVMRQQSWLMRLIQGVRSD